MRLLLIVFLILGINFSALACFCAPFTLCEYLGHLEDNETTLIFMGSFIQEESITSSISVVQYKIEKIYKGEVVTPDSPHYNNEPYTNTDSTVWLLSGYSDSCYRKLDGSKAIFVLTYNPGWPDHDAVGYVPSICNSDYFPISEDQTITGYIYSGDDVTMELSEFEELLPIGCNPLATNDEPTSVTNQINVYPNPATNVVNFDFVGSEDSWNVTLFDKTGKIIRVTDDSSINLGELDPGIYFLSFTNGKTIHTKKIVKN